MLSQRWNSFRVCSLCDEIVSSYAQFAIKSFPRMLSMRLRMLQFSKITQKYQIKMPILTINNRNSEKPSRNLSNRTKVKILGKKNFFDGSPKFDSAYAQSPRNSGKIEGKESKCTYYKLTSQIIPERNAKEQHVRHFLITLAIFVNIFPTFSTGIQWTLYKMQKRNIAKDDIQNHRCSSIITRI